MDIETIDQNYQQLQQQSQQTVQAIANLAQKLQAAAGEGDQQAREWLLDLKEITLGFQQEQHQVTNLLQAIHLYVENQPPQQPMYQQPQYQQPQYQQPMYQQPPIYQQRRSTAVAAVSSAARSARPSRPARVSRSARTSSTTSSSDPDLVPRTWDRLSAKGFPPIDGGSTEGNHRGTLRRSTRLCAARLVRRWGAGALVREAASGPRSWRPAERAPRPESGCEGRGGPGSGPPRSALSAFSAVVCRAGSRSPRPHPDRPGPVRRRDHRCAGPPGPRTGPAWGPRRA